MENELSLHYARALFELIRQDEYSTYLSCWENLLSSLEGKWLKFLSSYSISKEEKYDALDQVYGSFPKTFTNFLKVVISHHHVPLLPSIGESFLGLVHEALGIKEGVLFSAMPLKKEEVKQIEIALGKKLGYQIHLKEKVDHTLLGGIKVNIDGKVYDGTLRARLQELHRTLKGGAR